VFGVFERDGTLGTWYYTRGRPEYSSFTPPDRDWARARRILRAVHGIRSPEIRGLVVDAMIKYGEGLETDEWSRAFLVLWQVLEVLTLQSEGRMNMAEIGDRIALLLGQHQQERDLLAALAETRNKLVHVGTYPDEYGLDEMQWLKGIVEDSIDSLMSRWAPRLKTRQDLRLLYGSLGLGDTELKQRIRVNGAVLSWRKRRSKEARRVTALAELAPNKPQARSLTVPDFLRPVSAA
jgi:hypothetical protein